MRALEDRVAQELADLVDDLPGGLSTRGRGLPHAVVTPSARYADAVVDHCFEQGLLLETAGAHGEVVKLLPPLTVSDDDLEWGLGMLGHAVRTAARAG